MDAIVYDKVGKEAEKVREALYGIYPQETITDAAIASFDDGADNMPIKKLVAQIEPVQDLHGYDSPWPGGGMGNLWKTPEPQTKNGVTITIGSDGSIILNGTCTGALNIETKIFLKAGDYYLKDFSEGTFPNNASAKADIAINGSGTWKITNAGNTTQSVLTEDATASLRIRLDSGFTYNNAKVKPMFVVGTTAPSTWYPYSNICPISGYTGAEISNAAVNIWDEEWEVGQYNATTGKKADNSNNIRSKNFISCKPNTTYSFVWDGWTAWAEQILFYDANYNFLNERKSFGSLPSTFTTSANASYMTFFLAGLSEYNHDVSINYPATDTEYHPYQGNQISVTFPSEAGTVYGGMITTNADGIGVLTRDKVYTLVSTSAYFYDWPAGNGYYWYPPNIKSGTYRDGLCNCLRTIKSPSDKSRGVLFGIGNNNIVYFQDVKSVWGNTIAEVTDYLAVNPVEIVYDRSSIVEYNLTVPQITTLLGTNNIWADTGNIEKLTYRADLGRYIDSHITTAVANALNA